MSPNARAAAKNQPSAPLALPPTPHPPALSAGVVSVGVDPGAAADPPPWLVVGGVAPWFEPEVLPPELSADPWKVDASAPPYDGGMQYREVGGGVGVGAHVVVVTAPSTLSTTPAQPLRAPPLEPSHVHVAGHSLSALQLIVSATQLEVPVGVVVQTVTGGAPSPDTLPSQTPFVFGVHVK